MPGGRNGRSKEMRDEAEQNNERLWKVYLVGQKVSPRGTLGFSRTGP